MFTATATLTLPSTVTGSWPRPRWFDVSMWGRPLDTCMMDVRFREKFQDALAVVISEHERAGLDLHTDAGCRRTQIGEPRLHCRANTFGKDHEAVKFMGDAFTREVGGRDGVEVWIHTCWGNPNTQRLMEDTSYAASLELYLERCKGDVW